VATLKELLFKFAADIKPRSQTLPGNAYPEALLDLELISYPHKYTVNIWECPLFPLSAVTRWVMVLHPELPHVCPPRSIHGSIHGSTTWLYQSIAPLRPATAILVHPCASAKDSPFALFWITPHNYQHGHAQRHSLWSPTD